MSTTEPAGHLAIGEVLTLLREDFPDVTISKIRFLESQGLIQPERTPSGYRKFFEGDIERLRWVLRQQKERFLPLKVIKERLDSGEALGDLDDDRPSQPSLFGATPEAATGPEPVASAPPAAPAPAEEAAAQEAPSTDPAAWLAALQEGPKRRPPSRPVERPLVLDDDAGSSTRYGLPELAEATGLSEEQVLQLVEFGLVRRLVMGGVECFDEAALDAARVAAGFLTRGIEARHLRAYKLSAEREVALFEQLILPLLRQRNPAARTQATEQLAELTALGGELRQALLRQALRTSLQRP